MHLSRLASDLTLWATAEFGFVEIADAFATGSSIMPQKKNPDVAELIRGKSGRLYGNLVAVLTTMKGLPLTYNSDMQEDKEPLFDSVDTLEAIFRVLPPMLRTLTFREDRMREAAGAHYSTATDLADYLVRKGLPFREAHEVVGKTVRHGIATGKELGELSLEEFQPFSPLVGPDVHAALTVESSLAARAVLGGTAPEAVKRAHRRRPRGDRPGVTRGRRARSIAPRSIAWLLIGFALLGAGVLGCGKKGPPVAPERRLPAPPRRRLAAVIEGPTVVLSWSNPTRRHDGTAMRDLAVVKVHRQRMQAAVEPRAAMLSSGRVVGYEEIAAIRLDEAAAAGGDGGPADGSTRAGLTPGRRYAYVVTAIDSTGRSSAPSERLVVDLVAAPGVPRDLSSAAGDARVTLRWQRPEAAGRRIAGDRRGALPRAAGDGGGRGAGDAGQRGAHRRDRADRHRPRQRHGVSVRGARGPHRPGRGAGVRGAPAAASATPVDTTPPSPPAELVAIPTAGSVRLAWRPSPEPDVALYAVYRAVGNGPFVRVGTTAAINTVFIDRDVTAATAYRYAVTALDRARRANESGRSNEVRVQAE